MTASALMRQLHAPPPEPETQSQVAGVEHAEGSITQEWFGGTPAGPARRTEQYCVATSQRSVGPHANVVVPASALPESALPESELPESALPESELPASAALESPPASLAPASPAPASLAPASLAPESAPASNAPASRPPESRPPESKALESSPPSRGAMRSHGPHRPSASQVSEPVPVVQARISPGMQSPAVGVELVHEVRTKAKRSGKRCVDMSRG